MDHYVTQKEALPLSLFTATPRLTKRLRPRCRAKTRRGSPCQAPAVWNRVVDRPVNGRCKLHGGLSTGPKTPEGKRRSAQAARDGLKRYWAQRRKREEASKQTTRVVGLTHGGKFNA